MILLGLGHRREGSIGKGLRSRLPRNSLTGEQARSPLETSSQFGPEEPRSDDSYAFPMTPPGFKRGGWGPIEEGSRSSFLAVHSRAKPPLETSFIFKPAEAKSGDSYAFPMTPLGLEHRGLGP